MTRVVGLDHVQIAIPVGGEAAVRRFYADDPFGNRLELVDRPDGGFIDKGRSVGS